MYADVEQTQERPQHEVARQLCFVHGCLGPGRPRRHASCPPAVPSLCSLCLEHTVVRASLGWQERLSMIVGWPLLKCLSLSNCSQRWYHSRKAKPKPWPGSARKSAPRQLPSRRVLCRPSIVSSLLAPGQAQSWGLLPESHMAQGNPLWITSWLNMSQRRRRTSTTTKTTLPLLVLLLRLLLLLLLLTTTTPTPSPTHPPTPINPLTPTPTPIPTPSTLLYSTPLHSTLL